jgi:hypothetical protein
MADLGVVYLYRFADGELPVRAFLDSYRAHPAGAEHDLHVILKGFPDRSSLASARALFAGLPLNPIELDDTGYDVGSYFAAAKVVSNRRLIFFNTFTELLADDWLKKFDNALSLSNVGLVGATGSWQSLSNYYSVTVRQGWRRTKELLGGFVEQPSGAQQTEAQQEDGQAIRQTDLRRRLGHGLRFLYVAVRIDRYLLYLYQYGRFPNPHIRTNAFMIERNRFLSLYAPAFKKKENAYKFESGRRSMTKQIIAQGLNPVVVDRNGAVYGASEWRSSSTFWADEQPNLIVADKRTRDYAKASRGHRIFLQNNAWVHPSGWVMAGN